MCGREEWAKFRRYHYLNTELPSQAICYGLYDNDNIVGFLAVIHQPSKNVKIKRVTRLVILPDYQGIGLGTKFLNIMADYYSSMGYDFSIVTSAKNLIYSLKKSDKWCCNRYSIQKANNSIESLNRTTRTKCKTASFFYKKNL